MHFGVAAAVEAIRDAELPGHATRPAPVSSSAAPPAACRASSRSSTCSSERGPGRVSPALAAEHADRHHDQPRRHDVRRARRQLLASSRRCASGTHAIGDAAEVIKRDQADVIIAGGTESSMVPVILAGFCAMRALVDEREDPTRASRPFNVDRAGFVMAEGAAVLLVEELEHALRPRRADLLRGDRLRRLQRRLPRRHAAPRLDRRDRDDALGDPARRHRPGATSTTSTPTAPSTPYNDPAETQCDQGRVRRARLRAGGVVEQVDDRPPVRRGRRRRGAGDGADDPPRRDPADDQPATPTPSATSTTCPTWPARPRCGSRSRTRWAWAATTAASSSVPWMNNGARHRYSSSTQGVGRE